jgi:hypothetical protein
MYKDNRIRRQADIEISVKSYEETCYGCPSIFEFEDYEGTKYHFRLRHGYARIVCEDTDEVLLSDSMNGFDGICSWDDARRWARINGIEIKY